MNSLIFDTDVLSTFGKIKRFELLRKLLPDATFLIPPSVYGELFKARDRGYEFADHLLWGGILEVTPLTKEGLGFLSRLREERRSLGSFWCYSPR
jgi:hypothetical protein